MPNATAWDEFRLVKAIADAKSLTGAAEALGLNHSTVFRRLGALEASLGARLFERSRGGYAPTPAGEEMIRVAGRMEQELIDFERAVAGRDPKPAGELRIATNDAFLHWLIGPALNSFRKAYPAILLDITVSHQPLNLSRRDADVAIRATPQPPETLVGRRIASIGWAAYAPQDWRDEPAAPWIAYGEGPGVAGARKWFATHVDPRAVVARVDAVAGLAQAVACGIGAGLLPCMIGSQLPGVKRVTEPEFFGDDMWLLTHADLRQSARVRAFMDHVGAELVKWRRSIEGALEPIPPKDPPRE